MEKKVIIDCVVYLIKFFQTLPYIIGIIYAYYSCLDGYNQVTNITTAIDFMILTSAKLRIILASLRYLYYTNLDTTYERKWIEWLAELYLLYTRDPIEAAKVILKEIVDYFS